MLSASCLYKVTWIVHTRKVQQQKKVTLVSHQMLQSYFIICCAGNPQQFFTYSLLNFVIVGKSLIASIAGMCWNLQRLSRLKMEKQRVTFPKLRCPNSWLYLLFNVYILFNIFLSNMFTLFPPVDDRSSLWRYADTTSASVAASCWEGRLQYQGLSFVS